MSLFSDKSEVVERYLDALRCNPHAIPPQELDPETANLIREVVALHLIPNQKAAKSSCEEVDAVEQRVWDRVMFAILAPPELEPNFIPTDDHGSKIIDFPTQHTLSHAETGFTDDGLAAKSPIFSLPSIYAPVLPRLNGFQRKQKTKLSFIATILLVVFCFTGLLSQYDELNDVELGGSATLKSYVTTPRLDSDTASDANPELLIRYQPSNVVWERLPRERTRDQVEEPDRSTLGIPIAPGKKNYPE
jgi:hypothetical protein